MFLTATVLNIPMIERGEGCIVPSFAIIQTYRSKNSTNKTFNSETYSLYFSDLITKYSF